MPTWISPTAIHSKCGEHASFPATQAIDGNSGTLWMHFASGYHWIVFDLSQTYTVSKIKIYQGSSFRFGESAGLDVYVSDDTGSWGSVVWSGALDATGWQESGAFSKNGRYVKVVSKSNALQQRMYEFEAYCATPPSGTPRSHGYIF